MNINVNVVNNLIYGVSRLLNIALLMGINHRKFNAAVARATEILKATTTRIEQDRE